MYYENNTKTIIIILGHLQFHFFLFYKMLLNNIYKYENKSFIFAKIKFCHRNNLMTLTFL